MCNLTIGRSRTNQFCFFVLHLVGYIVVVAHRSCVGSFAAPVDATSSFTFAAPVGFIPSVASAAPVGSIPSVASAAPVHSLLPSSADTTKIPYGFSNIPWAGNCCFMDSILQIIAAWCPEDVQEGSPLKTMIEKINNGCRAVTSEDVKAFKEGLSGNAKDMVKEGISGGDPYSFFVSLYKNKLKAAPLFFEEYMVAKDSQTNTILHTEVLPNSAYPMLMLYPNDPRVANSLLTMELLIANRANREEDEKLIDSMDFVRSVVAAHKDKKRQWFSQSKITRWPAKLPIYISRFCDGVRVGEEIQDPSTICIGEEKIIYHLKAFTVDYPSYNHVTACVKRGGQWYEVDDLHYKLPAGGIEPLHKQEMLVKVQDARLLFYEQA